MSRKLTKDSAFIFRITHRDNVPWVMANGLHCRNAKLVDANFVSIGSPGLIHDRHYRQIPCDPFGTLSDYVPFYFTPFTPMAYNIKTGFRGIRKRPPEEIVIFLSSLRTLQERGIRFLFTDRHAYLAAARFSSDLADLSRIAWSTLQRRDFKHDPEDPGKVERYQAEALVYQHLPLSAVHAILCYNDMVANAVREKAVSFGHTLKVAATPWWYV